MRYASWTTAAGESQWGAVREDEVVDANRALATAGLPPVASVADLIAAGPEVWATAADALRHATHGVPLDSVRLTAPYLPRGTIFAAGANYADHAAEAQAAGALTGLPAQPVVFTKGLSSVCGPDDDVQWRSDLTSKLDYEVELAAVIGTGGRDVHPERALDHVFGYTVLNDISARDVQHDRPTGQWFLGKSMDTFCPIGPWIVTADELGDPTDLPISLSLNGEERQSSSTRHLLFGIDVLIAEISRYTTLVPGDLLATGTPAGVGASAEPPRFLVDGDLLEATVGGIGTLRNRVVRR